MREDPASVRDLAGFAPTEKGAPDEMSDVEGWLAHHFQNQTMPVSFTLDDQPSSRLLRKWKFTHTETIVGEGTRKRTITATDPKTGLELTCEATLFERSPAVDWVVRVTNRSGKESPLLEDLQVLDEHFLKPESEKREFILRHSRGSRAWSDDFTSIDTLLTPNSRHTFGGHGGRSSDADLPFIWQRRIA